MIPDLGEIKVTPLASGRDWEGYPPGYDAHPARNHPAFVRELIQLHPDPIYTVWDPQAGVGTTMREAELVWRRVKAFGWDIEPKWRALWKPGWELEHPEPGSIGLIVSSPAFWKTNHGRGVGPAQEANQASIGSRAGCEWSAGELPEGHLGGAISQYSWILLARQVLERCYHALAPGGHLVWIVRDKVLNGKPCLFDELSAALIRLARFDLVGTYWRRLIPTANEQLRAAGVERNWKGQGYLPECVVPELQTIDRELAIVGRKT